MHENNFRCCYGIMTRDHGAFNYLYRWAVRHMLTEFLMVAILVYLQFSDRYAGIWSMSAAVISLIGASIPSLCFSNAPGWRVNFGLQVLVIIIRIAVVAFIIYSFTKDFQDTELASNRICQLATILLSTLSLSPLFHMSLKSSWLINMRPMDMRGPHMHSSGSSRTSGREFMTSNREYGNGNRPYLSNGSNSRKSFDSENNNGINNMNTNSMNGSSNNMGMAMSMARDRYMRDREIDNIAEGDEEDGDNDGEDDDDDNNNDDDDEGNDEFQSEVASSAMSFASLAPFYQTKTMKNTADFTDKENVLFSFENVMHSSKKNLVDGQLSNTINGNLIDANDNVIEEVVYQEKVFQNNPMASHHNSGRFRLNHEASHETLTTAGSWINRPQSGRLPLALSPRSMRDDERIMHGGGGSGGGESLYKIGGCDVGISGKSTRSNFGIMRGDSRPESMKGTLATGELRAEQRGGGVWGTGLLAGSRSGSEYDSMRFGSPRETLQGNISKEAFI